MDRLGDEMSVGQKVREQNWTLSLQGRSGITIAYVDFAKAFDTVSHDKLLHCLRFVRNRW